MGEFGAGVDRFGVGVRVDVFVPARSGENRTVTHPEIGSVISGEQETCEVTALEPERLQRLARAQDVAGEREFWYMAIFSPGGLRRTMFGPRIACIRST